MLKIGILGAARIAPMSLVQPARKIPDVVVAAVAARDASRAGKFARKHDIPLILNDYQALIECPDIDAVYIPLPNGLHGEWTLRALEAGKHVLCEKPFSSNAEEARQMVATAQRTGKLLMEAFHYRYHPLAARIREIIPRLGPLQRINSEMCFPLPRFKDIRYDYSLGGGSNMDAGAYTANMLRMVAAASGIPGLQHNPEVVSATAKLRDPRVDRAMTAELAWPGGTTGRIVNSMWSRKLLRIGLRAVGERGELSVINPVVPQLYHRLTLVLDGVRTTEKVTGESSYYYQLQEFARRVESGVQSTDLADSIATMELIDAIYLAAGLPLRGH